MERKGVPPVTWTSRLSVADGAATQQHCSPLKQTGPPPAVRPLLQMKIPDQPGPAEVGRRVAAPDGQRATVRFVGTVPPTKGLWLGVEWDDPERGKHDGSHEGVHYFTCRHPQGGSFVRPGKVSIGVDYLTAVRRRYDYGTDLQQVREEAVVLDTKTVQMVGLEAITEEQKVETLTAVCLRACEVSGAGPEGQVRASTPRVRSLDLCRNLLGSWEDVANITSQMEHLQDLQLSHNRLSVPSDPGSRPQAFSCLRVLSLTNCDLTWPQLLQVSPWWPCVEELYLSENHITQLHRPVEVLQSLTLLDLSGNRLEEESLLSLGHLPRLKNLYLSNTGLTGIRFDDAEPGGQTDMFPHLDWLDLGRNNISEWWVVVELAKLRCLRQLSLLRAPLLDADPQTALQVVLAHLGRLEVLNRSTVKPADRRGAELDYLKAFTGAWLEAGGHRDPQRSQPSALFTRQHPRFMTLVHKYGAPEEGELKKEEPFALKNQLLSVTFLCPEEADRKPVAKKLPESMTVQKVKGLLYRLLKIPGAQLRLSYSSAKMEGTEVGLDSDLKTLRFYSVEDGDTVLVRWS